MNPNEEIVLETETEGISLADIDAMLAALEQLLGTAEEQR